ncbi:hypothetical protein BH10BAC5_BH10BAC5_06900 [soil metagenome]
MAKKHYESYLIIDGNLEESVIEEVINKFEGFLKKNEAEITKTDKMGRRKLAYSIKNRLNGFYVCFEFSAEPTLVTKLERTIKLDENIIRYLTLTLDKKTLAEKEQYLQKRAAYLSKISEAKEQEKAEETAAAVNTAEKEEKKVAEPA